MVAAAMLVLVLVLGDSAIGGANGAPERQISTSVY
jgi:hypothetical protein